MDVYRRRPEYVEAKLLTKETAEEIAEWTRGYVLNLGDGTVAVFFEVLDTLLRVNQDMYVIKTQAGDWNIMPKIDFEGRYERT